jgi:hypothetical protein
MPTTECDRPGGNEHHFFALASQTHHIFDQRLEPGTIESPGCGIDQQSRTDLDHDAAGLRQRGTGVSGICAGRHAESTSTRGTIEQSRSKIPASLRILRVEVMVVSRDNEPVKGQWYENTEDQETFRVLSVDEDVELIEIEYLDGEIEELDIEEWHELDLELIAEPEGWSEDDEDEEEDDEEWDDEDEDEDDDWDEDEEEDWEDDNDDGRER